MKSTVNISFWLYKSKANSKGLAPVYLRIKHDSKRAEIATGVFVAEKKWDGKKERVKATAPNSEISNELLDKLEQKFKKVHLELISQNLPFNIDTLKTRVITGQESYKTVLQVFEMHNKWLASLIGKDYTLATSIRYRTTFSHLRQFIKKQYNRGDFLLEELDLTFLEDLEYYFKTVRNCNHNSSLKYIRLFKKVVNWARAKKWILVNPFVGHKSKTTPVKIEFLTQGEVDRIEKKKFSIPRLELTKNVFVFSCYTGLAYVDVRNLRSENIQTINGDEWIITCRTKTNIPVRVPLLPQAKKILNQYRQTSKADCIFPMLSNQKTNAYLKEIADLCGINKRLNFHLARHTFGSTVTLGNGVPIAVISNWLGHTSIRSTQIYAKVIDSLSTEEMRKVEQKLST